MDEIIVLANRVVFLDDEVRKLNRQQQEWERGYPVARHLLIAQRNQTTVERDLVAAALVESAARDPISLARFLAAGDKP